MVFHNICFPSFVCQMSHCIYQKKKRQQHQQQQQQLNSSMNMYVVVLYFLVYVLFCHREYCSFSTFSPRNSAVFVCQHRKKSQRIGIECLDYGCFYERIPRMNKMSSNIYIVNGNFIDLLVLSNTATQTWNTYSDLTTMFTKQLAFPYRISNGKKNVTQMAIIIDSDQNSDIQNGLDHRKILNKDIFKLLIHWITWMV